MKGISSRVFFFFDFLLFNLAFFCWLFLRLRFGFYAETRLLPSLIISLVISGYWILVFTFFGMYRRQRTFSRLDELLDVIKVTLIGVLFIFLLTSDYQSGFSQTFKLSRMLILVYWAILVFFIGGGRLLLLTFHRWWLATGHGHERTLIVGWGKKAWEIYDQTSAAPALGYTIVGFVSPEEKFPIRAKYKKVPLLGSIHSLREIIQKKNIQQVFIALPRRSATLLEKIILECNGLPVGIKVVPDLYDVVVGQVRTHQIYGFPLIEIFPQLMAPWEWVVKRILDISISFVILIVSIPLSLVIALAIRLDSKGPVFYMQERVGKNGKIFRIIKFRSMIPDAEKFSGPVWATKNDPRVTRVGRVLRKLRLDEIPQFINVLKGDMSLVGPRPERPFFVEKLKKIYPLYTRRLLIKPGITGWAQIKGSYDQTIEDVKKKLEYDLFYFENMSFRMDLKILIMTVYIMLKGKGH